MLHPPSVSVYAPSFYSSFTFLISFSLCLSVLLCQHIFPALLPYWIDNICWAWRRILVAAHADMRLSVCSAKLHTPVEQVENGCCGCYSLLPLKYLLYIVLHVTSTSECQNANMQCKFSASLMHSIMESFCWLFLKSHINDVQFMELL